MVPVTPSYFYAYDPATGQIGMVSNRRPSGHVLEAPVLRDPARVRVVDGALVDRPRLVDAETLSFRVGDVFRVANVPPGTRLFFEDMANPFTVDDGVIEIALTRADRWEIVIDPPFPFVRQMIVVTADAP